MIRRNLTEIMKFTHEICFKFYYTSVMFVDLSTFTFDILICVCSRRKLSQRPSDEAELAAGWRVRSERSLDEAISEEALQGGQVTPVFHVVIANRGQDDVDAFDRRVTILSASLTAPFLVLTAIAHLI